MKKTLLLLLLIVIPCFSFSQGRWINHRSHTALPSTNVRDVLIDSMGNKWFATDNGLAKFDGFNWTIYKAAYLQLKSNDIHALAEDKNGNIWITTSQDVEVFDGESWTYYDESDGLSSGTYTSIKADTNGNIWLGNVTGITKFDGVEFKNITHINENKISAVTDIEVDQEGNIWFSHWNQITYKGNISVYKNGIWIIYESQSLGKAASSIPRLSLANGKIWIGSHSGFSYFQNNTFNNFEIPSEIEKPDLSGEIIEDGLGNLWFLRRTYYPGAFKYVSGNSTWKHYSFNNGSITSNYNTITSGKSDGTHTWFSSTDGGVFKYNFNTDTFSNINTTNGLAANNITKIFMETPGVPWVGSTSNDKTSYYLDKPHEDGWLSLPFPFHLYELSNIFRDIQERIWLVRRSYSTSVLDNGKWTTYTPTNSLLLNNYIYASTTDKSGNSYFTFQDQGTRIGTVIMFDGTKWQNITSSHAYLNGYISNIEVTSDGKVWFFSDKGTVVKSGNQWTANDVIPLYSQATVADKNGGIWLGYRNKIVHYANGSITVHDLSELLGVNGTSDSFEMKDIAIDFKGNIWAGGYVYDKFEDHPGLVRFDGLSWKAYSKSDGLISNAVNTITTDELGNVWIGTQNGLSQLVLFTETVTINKTNINCYGGNDGSITLTPEGLTPPYQYSIDGGKSFGLENNFKGLAAGSYHVIVKDGKGLTAHDELITLTQPEGVFTWKVTPVSCAGARDGAIALTIQNNDAPISFQWHKDGIPITNANTQNITDLSRGIYKVVVSYGECIVTKVIEVPEPQPLQATIDHLNSCGNGSGGRIDIRTTIGGTAPYKYSIDSGVTFQTQKVFTGLAVGNYQVLVQDSKGCTFTTSQVTIEQKEKPEPVINVTGSLSLCTGSSTILRTSQSYEKYEWYDDKGSLLSTNESFEVKQAGTFHVVVYQDQCQATSKTVTTTMVTPYNLQQICIVTVDTDTGKNKIVWTKTEGKNIASYRIYKEVGTSQFSLIGSVAFNSDNFFIDRDSDPMKASERYIISVLDVCGNESIKSPAHKTIYLQASLGVNDKINLTWNNYQGFNYTQVNILRGSSPSSLQLLDTRPANNNTYTDTNPVPTQMVYVIEAVTNYSCEVNTEEGKRVNLNVTQLNSNAATRSNPSAARGPLGVKGNIDADTKLVVYPNPASSDMTIELKEGAIIHSIRLLDISGREVHSSLVRNGGSSTVLECKAKAGFYILEVMDIKNITYRKRVILQ